MRPGLNRSLSGRACTITPPRKKLNYATDTPSLDQYLIHPIFIAVV